MRNFVRLSGNGETISFSDTVDLESIAGRLNVALNEPTPSRGPIETYARYYQNVGYNYNHVNPYPKETDVEVGSYVIDVSTTTYGGVNQIKVEQVTNKTFRGVSTTPKATYRSLAEFVSSFNKPRYKFVVGKVYRFNYEGGTKPGDKRVAKVVEIHDGEGKILTDDLLKGKPRWFFYNKIENLEEVPL